LEDIDVDGKVIYLKETGYGNVDWIRLAQYSDQCRTLNDKVMNLQDA